MDIKAKLCTEFPVTPTHMENIIKLIDDGNTIPFIARYRKEQHGACDDQKNDSRNRGISRKSRNARGA